MTIAYLGGFILLAVLAMEDVREKKISVNKAALSGAAALLLRIWQGRLDPMEMAVSLVPGLILVLFAFLFQKSIGAGDGIALLALGMWTDGRFTFFVMMWGMFLSGWYGVGCLIRKRREPFAFIPFLLVGMEVMLLYVS